MNKEISIRPGNANDVPQVLALIQELADFEKEPDAVLVTETELLEDGFGENPAYELIVAEHNGKLLGMSLYYYRYSTWKGRCLYLEDLIVTEDSRGKGIGKSLFIATVNVAKAANCRKMNWQVLDWNQPAIDFYKLFQAELDEEWINGSLSFM